MKALLYRDIKERGSDIHFQLGTNPVIMLFVLVATLALACAEDYIPGHSPNWVGRDVSVQIVGGVETARGAYPWQLSLERCSSMGCSHSCGAVLISPTWAITAAHCVTSSILSGYNIVAGQHVRGEIPRGDPRRQVPSKIVSHPRDASFREDFAVVQLPRAFPVDGRLINPVAMPASHPADFTSNECWISGWGAMRGGGPLPRNLQHARISVITNADCRRRMGTINDYHICIYDHESQRRGSCNGDSGGPLNCKVGSTWQVAGVTSFGRRGCPPTSPSVYARVSYFRAWIKRQTGV